MIQLMGNPTKQQQGDPSIQLKSDSTKQLQGDPTKPQQDDATEQLQGDLTKKIGVISQIGGKGNKTQNVPISIWEF